MVADQRRGLRSGVHRVDRRPDREDVEDELFELVTALSWAVDRFGDDVERARRRVAPATPGVFPP